MADSNPNDWLSWLAVGGVTAWLTAFVALRNNDKAIITDNITKERKEWREFLRKWIEDVSELSIQNSWGVRRYLQYRAKLIARLNPNDKYDIKIINFFDEKFSSGKKVDCDDIKELQVKIGCLLKQDWENVKQDCTSVWRKYWSIDNYLKFLIVKRKEYLQLSTPYQKYEDISKVYGFDSLKVFIFSIFVPIFMYLSYLYFEKKYPLDISLTILILYIFAIILSKSFYSIYSICKAIIISIMLFFCM